MRSLEKILTTVMQGSLVVLTLVLFWFAFVYYPKTMSDLRSGSFGFNYNFFKPVIASKYDFPIETEAYRIALGGESATYYIFINGGNLAEYEMNKASARLALKTALSLENTCSVNLVYVSTAKLEIPQNLRNSDCNK